MEEICVRLMNKLNQTRITANWIHSFSYFHPSSEADRINEYTDLCHRAQMNLSGTVRLLVPAGNFRSCAIQIPRFIEF